MKTPTDIVSTIQLDEGSDDSIAFHTMEEHSSSDEFLSNEDILALGLNDDGGERLRFFDSQSLDSLSKSSFYWNESLNNELLARKLLTHVVLGEQDHAHAMIEANPALLLIRTKVVDYSGRTIIATPFQAALGAEDTLMWQMMLDYIEPEKALRQYNQQFPEGIDVKSARELLPIYNTLAQAIIEGRGEEAIANFREFITQPDTITQGKHFNMQHLVAAMHVYADRFDDLGSYNNQKMFWSQVIGYVQRQMPSVYAQAHCSDLKNIEENEGAFERTLDLKNNNGEPLFPLGALDSGLGFDFGVLSWRVLAALGVGSASPGARRAGRVALPAVVMSHVAEKLCKEKTGELRDLRERLESVVSYQPK